MLQAAIDASQANVTGTARIKLYKGNVTVVGRKSERSLFDPGIASFEEAGGYRQADATGFISLNGLRLRTAQAQAGLTAAPRQRALRRARGRALRGPRRARARSVAASRDRQPEHGARARPRAWSSAADDARAPASRRSTKRRPPPTRPGAAASASPPIPAVEQFTSSLAIDLRMAVAGRARLDRPRARAASARACCRRARRRRSSAASARVLREIGSGDVPARSPSDEDVHMASRRA